MAFTASASPWTTFRTPVTSVPASAPASMNSSARRTGTLGSFSEGLRMKVLPQAMATPNIHIGIIAGKLNGVMPAPTPKRLAHGIDVDPGSGALGVLALEHVRNAAGELDDLQPTLDVAARVGDDLAVLAGEQRRQLVHPRLDQALVGEHHPRPPLGIDRRPGRLRALGGGHREIDIGARGKVDAGLDGAGVRVEDVAEPGRGAGLGAAVDEVKDIGHDDVLPEGPCDHPASIPSSLP